MDMKEVLLKRRSIRKYTEEKVSEEDIQFILEMAMSGPSACNKTPWEFFVISNEEILDKLNHATRYSSCEAPLNIVVCGNLRKALPLQYQDYWIEDCSAATENILLAATSIGLGTLWCGVYPEKRNIKHVSEILELPEHLIPLNIIKIGHPAEVKESRHQFNEKKVHFLK